MGSRIGVDIGGTFTDFIVMDDEGNLDVYKTPSTPSAPEEAVFSGINDLAAEAGASVDTYLSDVDVFIHGTTIATNTVIQRNGPKMGLLHTDGFRDILALRDGHKPDDRYDLHMPPPDPFIPRYLRLGVEERVLASGETELPLSEESVREALATFRDNGVESVAVSLLWSMLDPAHEQRVGEIIREELPEAYVALSSDILPAIREWPRTCATVLSGYVGPVLGGYLTKVSDYLHENGYRYDLLIMQLTGGSASVTEIEKRPSLAIGSGPAAGPPAGLVIGAEEDEKNLMVVDMGGTSFEVSLITDGAFTMSREIAIDDMPVGVAAVDTESIGAGGGSIAWVDAGGMLRVGPRSAGAAPGPACLGQGGEEPTVTDANLILGYLNPDFYLGGRMKLDVELANAAMGRVAEPLGLDVVEAAAAVYRIVNTNMVGAMRAVSVMRGVDPRDYTVIVGGGAGGTHAAKIAAELGVKKAICPVVSSGLCAFGMLVADVRHSYLTTYPSATDDLDVDRVNQVMAEMEEQALSELEAEGFERAQITLERFVDAKYPYQINEIMIPVMPGKLSGDAGSQLADTFHEIHERLYTYCVREMSVGFSGWHVVAVGHLPSVPLKREQTNGHPTSAAVKETRSVYFPENGDYVDTRVFDGEKLQAGMVLEGPAIAELPTTTLVIFPGHTLAVNEFGDFTIEIPQDPAVAGVRAVGSPPRLALDPVWRSLARAQRVGAQRRSAEHAARRRREPNAHDRDKHSCERERAGRIATGNLDDDRHGWDQEQDRRRTRGLHPVEDDEQDQERYCCNRAYPDHGQPEARRRPVRPRSAGYGESHGQQNNCANRVLDHAYADHVRAGAVAHHGA